MAKTSKKPAETVLFVDNRDIPPKADRYGDGGLIVDDALLARYRHAPDNCVGAHPKVTRALVREIDALRTIIANLAARKRRAS